MKDTLARWTQDNPLAVGAVAVAVGLIVGLSLRRTDSENRAFGAVKDSLLDKAEETEQVREAVLHAPRVGRVVERATGPRFWPDPNQAS